MFTVLKPIVILLAHKAGEIGTGPAHFAADSVKSDRLLAIIAKRPSGSLSA